jgi:catechol 2,3-dioxygenase-like lactoylglutathione lyase family enzyme
MNAISSLTLAGLVAVILTTKLRQDEQAKKDEPLQLGNFCVSLDVKDIKASKAFYEKLDFKQTSGDLEQNWVVLMNGTTTIGLFQGMFEKNMLTFNPGWDWKKETLKEFQDVRELQRTLKARGIQLETEADETTDGPAFFTLVDPDGNPILVDQGVPKPKH